MRRWLCVVLCILALAPVLAAQQPNDPATKEDVQKLFEMMQFRKMMDSTMDTMRQQLPQLMASMKAEMDVKTTPEQDAEADRIMNRCLEKVLRTAPWDEIVAAMVPVYQRHFTHGEVRELIRFYASPVGQKVLTEQPKMAGEYMKDMMPIMQKWQRNAMAEMKTEIDGYLAKVKTEQKPVTTYP